MLKIQNFWNQWTARRRGSLSPAFENVFKKLMSKRKKRKFVCKRSDKRGGGGETSKVSSTWYAKFWIFWMHFYQKGQANDKISARKVALREFGSKSNPASKREFVPTWLEFSHCLVTWMRNIANKSGVIIRELSVVDQSSPKMNPTYLLNEWAQHGFIRFSQTSFALTVTFFDKVIRHLSQELTYLSLSIREATR